MRARFPTISGVVCPAESNRLFVADHGDAFDGEGVAEERAADGDGRPSIAERYASAGSYVGAVEAAAQRLVGERLLLPEDAADYVERARSEPALG